MSDYCGSRFVFQDVHNVFQSLKYLHGYISKFPMIFSLEFLYFQ